MCLEKYLFSNILELQIIVIILPFAKSAKCKSSINVKIEIRNTGIVLPKLLFFFYLKWKLFQKCVQYIFASKRIVQETILTYNEFFSILPKLF